ncbi:MAG TPA: choice-of-anchor Q domain-containing protein, partial [Pirellulales bacterium]|nr:choice-of-anchor Q domain-containing protein [Pirellulales bacterium]
MSRSQHRSWWNRLIRSSSSDRRTKKKRRTAPRFAERLEDRSLLTTVTVNTLNDTHAANASTSDVDGSGNVSLRSAIEYLNATATSGDTIDFDSSLFTSGPARITLSGSQLTINEPLSILGPGANQLTIDANKHSGIFDVEANATISGLTLTNGTGAFLNNINLNGAGGAIFNAYSANLTLIDNAIIGNTATANDGGGICNLGTLTSTGNTISGNTAPGYYGAGIYNQGSLISTLDTISGNSAYSGGGLENSPGDTATLVNDTVAGNSESTAGINNTNSNATLNVLNTIAVGNGGADLSGTIAAGGHNVIGGTIAQILATDGGGNPLLANNGGPTQTIALAANSPAIGEAGALATLAGNLNASDATSVVNVSSTTFLAVGDSLAVGSEIVSVTAISGNSITIARAQNGSAEASHSTGDSLYLAFDQRGFVRSSQDAGAVASGQTIATPTVAVTDNGGTYNGSPFPATSASVTAGPATLASLTQDAGTLSFTYYVGNGTSGTNLGSTAPTNAGTYTVVAHYTSDNANYASADSNAVPFIIAAAPLTVAASTQTKLVRDADPPLTYAITSGQLFGADQLSGELTRVPGNRAGAYDILQGTLTAGPNYDLTFVGSVLLVTRASTTVKTSHSGPVTKTGAPVTVSTPHVTTTSHGFRGTVTVTEFTTSPSRRVRRPGSFFDIHVGNPQNVDGTSQVQTTFTNLAPNRPLFYRQHTPLHVPSAVVNARQSLLQRLEANGSHPKLLRRLRDASGNPVVADASGGAAVTFTTGTFPSINGLNGTEMFSLSGPTVTNDPNVIEVGSEGLNSPVLEDTADLEGGAGPTGTITFNLYYNGGATPVYTETVNVNDNGAYSTTTGYTSVAAGSYQWTAQYSGDTNNSGDTDSSNDGLVNVVAVNTTGDPATPTAGQLSLREAIDQANAGTAGTTVITFDPAVFGSTPQTIDLAQGELPITSSLTIAGPGSGELTINGGGNSRIFDVNDGTGADDLNVAIDGLTLTDGNGTGSTVSPDGQGGAIYNAENLSLAGDVISGNAVESSTGASYGGGIYNAAGATLGMNGVTIGDNQATTTATGPIYASYGGGVYNAGDVASTDSAISANGALGGFGGGIYNVGTLTSASDTMSGNNAGYAGGIYNDATASITNDTISGNSAGGGAALTESDAGGIYNDGTLAMANDTVSGNTASGRGSPTAGLLNNGGTLSLIDSIVVGNDADSGPAGSSPANMGGTAPVDGGNNVIDVPIAQVLATDPTTGDPILADNGGPTQTIALVPGTTATPNPALGAAGALAALAAGLNNTDAVSTVQLSDATFLVVGDSLQIDNEIVVVQNVDLASNTIDIARGQDGTAEAAHNTGAGLYLALDQRGYVRVTQDIGAIEGPQASIVVNTLADAHADGYTTLREAITQADAEPYPGGTTITFAPGLTGTITLTQGELPITQAMTITGPGASVLAVSGNNQSRIFDVNDGNATPDINVAITGLTLTDGNVAGLDNGGAIYNAENLALSGDSTGGNNATRGGGIFNVGTLTSNNDTISGNSAAGIGGGGIYNDGTLTSTNDTISGNSAAGIGGGGIY